MTLTVAVVFGGRSTEHEVSLRSALNVLEALDRARFQPLLICVDHTGSWFWIEPGELARLAALPVGSNSAVRGQKLALVPGGETGKLVVLDRGVGPGVIDVVFPVIHGTFGEDGCLQGALRLLDLPFVGADVLGSAVGMDKEISKCLLAAAGLPVVEFATLHGTEEADYGALSARLGEVLFVKPACLGSSVGVSRVTDAATFGAAVREAFRFDRKVLIEAACPGRELECSVLGNERPEASAVGEILCHHDFYSYTAKYLDDEATDLAMPADLEPTVAAKVRELAVAAVKALGIEGMARVDFFLSREGRLFINEANTLPGFTRISMYPKLWTLGGLSMTALVSRLIELALERHAAEHGLDRCFRLETGAR
ncbi:MAG: D-alanine--D-alanine ligase A [Deltaproteobacteria bacterium RIFOXYA12_FULL_61_11]|nr:MAG: D-alanine--D-alanine ligase A [Deltaproteobacteria bacterium RIFOXYA12_FULL_61_11]